MKLALGTVQFGMDYGVSNHSGKIHINDVRYIVNKAISSGVCLFDTAPSYGESEYALGKCLPLNQGQIVTKTPHIDCDEISQNYLEAVRSTFENSLVNLNRDSVYTLMVHNPHDLKKNGVEKLFQFLLGLREQKLIQKIGVSLYEPDDIDLVVDNFPVDVVQVPINILDQRLCGDKLGKCMNRKVEVHARSVFLQGLLLSDVDNLPNKFVQFKRAFDRINEVAQKSDISLLEMALAYVSQLSAVKHMIVGVAGISQLDQIFLALESLRQKELDMIKWDELKSNNELLISPNNWKYL